MNKTINGLFVPVTAGKIVQKRILNIHSPEELFKIQWIYIHQYFKSHWIGFDFLYLHAQKRPSLDVVKSSVFHKKLDSCTRLRAFLYLVQKNQCFSRNKRCLADGTDSLQYLFHTIFRFKYRPGLRIIQKIQFQKAAVFLSGKHSYSCGLSGLPGTNQT